MVRTVVDETPVGITLRPGSIMMVLEFTDVRVRRTRACARRDAAAALLGSNQRRACRVQRRKLVGCERRGGILRDAAAEVDVFERMSGFAMERDEVFPHRFEGVGEGFDIGRLRADMDVYAANADEFGMLQSAAEGVWHFRRGDAELGGQERGLQTDVRARAISNEPQRDVRAFQRAARRLRRVRFRSGVTLIE